MNFIKKLFGSGHERQIREMWPLVQKINELEESYRSLSDDALRARTAELRQRFTAGETLDALLCEAFAVVKNGCRRLVGTQAEVCGHVLKWEMVPFDVQLIGGIALHRGMIAEMGTGEGKTLVATMPLYLNALTGQNVHLVTVNDYLARRDSQWMGHLLGYLGVSVGCIQNSMHPQERREQYAKDVTYGTNSEFGFDYLRDNGMAVSPEQLVQRGYAYAIIDEVDSILIDEARTPLIISGPSQISFSDQYYELKPRVEALVRRQRDFCNRLVDEARQLLEAKKDDEAAVKLYQVQQGMPKHKQLMHLQEEPATRKICEQIQRMMLTDMRKEEARALREQLYFVIDERGHDATLTEQGCEVLNPTEPDAFVLPDLTTMVSELELETGLSEADKIRKRHDIQTAFSEKSDRIHCVDQLIRAYCLYERDVQYVVQDNKVLIVDEFTGRILPGRRWSDGLHQAVEAKEGVRIERETQTLATITIQNYFRMYKKLAGMTGTAVTEASEFHDIYKLEVLPIPTNRPVRRVDHNDVIYKSQREKYKAIVDEVVARHAKGQPVLVGTVNVDSSELLSRMLRRVNIPHNVLNAKNHEREAEIVSRAGEAGAVMIATNMAGRGTDIKLGPGVVTVERSLIESKRTLDERVDGATLREKLLESPSGLHVIGSERHESRRIDRQLRGRSARQGDPGSSRFYVSLEDDLMRLFASDRIASIMAKLGLEEGQELEHSWLNRSIESAQKKVEQHHYSIRKRTLEYDDVMNKQREIVYGLRGDVVRSESVREHILDIFHDLVELRVEDILQDNDPASIKELLDIIIATFPIALHMDEVSALAADHAKLVDLIEDRIKAAYAIKVEAEDERLIRTMERQIILHVIDSHWQDYLKAMDDLRQGVALRAYGQRDPLVEFKREAFQMFEELMLTIKQEVSSMLFRSLSTMRSYVSTIAAAPPARISLSSAATVPQPTLGAVASGSENGAAATGEKTDVLKPHMRTEPRVNRNDPCPCGSGKKYKKCCGAGVGA